MKYIIIIIFKILLLLSPELKAQQLRIFNVNTVFKNESKAFVSLTDIYTFSDHPDSLAFPDMSNIGKGNTRQFEYIRLSSKYRNQFLLKTNISETDKVFIYSYSNNILVSFPVSNLNVVAYLNIYTPPEECPCPQYYYMIGFEIDKKFLKGFEDYFMNTLVYIGKHNPFILGKLNPIQWQISELSSFPEVKINPEDSGYFSKYAANKVYTFIYNDFKGYLRIFHRNEHQADYQLVVTDLKTNTIVFEKMYYDGEGSSPALLNFTSPEFGNAAMQWVGELFKNKPPVVFGFQYHSFGCPGIDFISRTEKPVYINCDNRH